VSTTPLLSVEGIRKLFPLSGGGMFDRMRGRVASRLHAVDGIDFRIGAGESVGLVGESGCGKSTLVRLITRTLDPSEGAILFDGEDLARIPARQFAHATQRPGIQMVFQDPTDSLNPRHTAREAIAEPLPSPSSINPPRIDSEAAEAADQVQLPEALLGRYPHQLSGGQKARVGIARAIALRPRLLVLDEPIANLDLQAQQLFLQDLRHLASSRRNPVAVILSSQQLHEIEAIADTIVFLKNGKVAYSGAANAFDRDRTTNVFELKADADRARLQQALAHLGGVDLDDTGLLWRITTPRTLTSRDLLHAVTQAGIEVGYFRDISTSTRKLFHQDPLTSCAA